MILHLLINIANTELSETTGSERWEVDIGLRCLPALHSGTGHGAHVLGCLSKGGMASSVSVGSPINCQKSIRHLKVTAYFRSRGRKLNLTTTRNAKVNNGPFANKFIRGKDHGAV